MITAKRNRSSCIRLFVLMLAVILSVGHVQAAAKTKTIAIWDFDNTTFMGDIAGYDYMIRILPEMFLSELSGVAGLKLIERVHLKAVLEEQKLSSGELASEESRLQLGKLLGAKNMMFGSFMAIEDEVRVDVRVIEVETTLTLLSVGETMKIDNLTPVVREMAKDVAGKLGAKALQKGKTKKVQQATWKLYDKGILLMDQKKYNEAIEIFKQVLDKDAEFSLAEQKIVQSLERLESQ